METTAITSVVNTITSNNGNGLPNLLAIFGLVLDALAIIISIIIYKISSNTSQKVFENSLARALAKANTPDEVNFAPFRISDKQKKEISNRIQKCLSKESTLRVITLAIALKKQLDEDRLIQLLDYLKANEAISWTGDLENSTIITILNEDLIYESISSC